MTDAGRLLMLVSWVPAVGAALAAGVYTTAVLDRILGHAVAREPIHVREVVLRPAREASVLLLQRRTTTERPDAALWALAPALLGALAAAVLLIVPASAGPARPDVQSGIVHYGAAMAMVMVAVYLQGWSANSIFPLVGAYRFVALALSYEMPLALVLIGTALPAESLSVSDIVRSQAHLWNLVRQPLGLPLYLIAGTGLAFWGPLNVADAADLAGGTTAELSGAPRLLWAVARAAILVAVAAMGAAAFLGGWHGPGLPGSLWMTLKTLVLVAVMLLAGHLLARVRLERFVVISWVVLIPLALLDVFAAGVLLLIPSVR